MSTVIVREHWRHSDSDREVCRREEGRLKISKIWKCVLPSSTEVKKGETGGRGPCLQYRGDDREIVFTYEVNLSHPGVYGRG